jgi:TolB-like protein/Tfp pilus assembly protein PilF
MCRQIERSYRLDEATAEPTKSDCSVFRGGFFDSLHNARTIRSIARWMQMPTIAISYRRDDSSSITGRLYDHLEAEFGPQNVFMDIDSIRPGVDFRERINETISRADAVVAVIGRRWLGEQPDGSRRIDDPNDFVRLEIASALKCKIPVIPVLVDDARMPKQDKLPPDIEPLVYRQALPLNSGLDFHQHTERLISGICESLNIAHPLARKGPAKPVLRHFPERHPPAGDRRKRIWNTAILLTVLGLVAVAGGFFALSHRSASRRAGPPSPAIPEKSIAVLPFENLSEDKANAYFADGIQDEILTRLSKIADLKVISRTSTQHFKSAPENLPEIARQLGVAHILEGSVQKAGNAVHINVQLIKAATDAHLWAESYDRELQNIFGVEGEVAKAIADQLRAKLSGQEEQVIAAKPTDNPEAYDSYLRGLAYSQKTQNTPANSLAAQKYFREAVRLDSNFASGWALLSYVDATGYLINTLQPTVALREEARQAAETALKLQPKLGEAVFAMGFYHYACVKDYDSAERYFEQARELALNGGQIRGVKQSPAFYLAFVARRRGQWKRSEAYFNEAERLDPANLKLLSEHANSYIMLRRFPEAVRKLDEVLNITPDDIDTLGLKGGIAQAEGDLPRAAAILAPLRPPPDDTGLVETQIYQFILERRPAPAISHLTEILAKPNPTLGYFIGELRFWLGFAEEVGGEHAAAQESWRQARAELEPFLKEQPENASIIGDLALIKACLGEKGAALALAEHALAVIPVEKDAVFGPAAVEILARVAAQTGESDRAIEALQKVLSVPYSSILPASTPLTPALLRLDPMFDPLRNDPRFATLIADHEK